MSEHPNRILVVEDDRSVRGQGHVLVILDVNLRGGTGLGLLRLLRHELGRKTPVIMLSGQRQEDNIVRALEWGANDYVTKPFSPRELVARVNRWMKAAEHVASVR